MRLPQLASAAAFALAALALSACATGPHTRVTRFQAASIPAGQTYYVVPREGTPSPQFYRYASILSQQLEAKGYHPAGTPQLADMLVRVDYGVDQGKTEYVREPYYGPGWGRGLGPYGFGYRDPFFDPYWGVYYGRPYWSGYSAFPFYYGWDDPFWYASSYGGYGRYGRFDSYTVYKSYLDMDIVQRGTNAPLFEGHARARSQTDELDKLVPNLIQAMFTGFPGKNGETVKITVPSKPKG